MALFSISRFSELPSTNNYALDNLESLADRRVVFAERQTKGHGRFERKWVSHVPGNIYMSLVLKPDRVEHLVSLTHYMSLVICDGLGEYGVTGRIKWPNDVQVGGKKISGLLGESKVAEGKVKGYVLGVGINLNLAQDDIKDIDQPVTSLNLETGKAVDREGFLGMLLGRFFNGYEGFLKGGFVSIRERYVQHSHLIGGIATVALVESKVNGKVKGFDDAGYLILETEDGKAQKINAGEVISFR